MADLPTVKFKYGSCDIICMDWTMRSSNPAGTSEFYFSKIFTNASGVQTTSLSIVTRFVCLFVCLILGREIDHSPPSVKNGWRYTSASFCTPYDVCRDITFQIALHKNKCTEF